MSDYSKVVVKKPWGHEYLVYQNSKVALWFLNIEENASTSMHCHPKKTTGLVLLDGEAELSFLADKKVISALSKNMIRRGLFHSSKAISKSGAKIFEIETPNDKYDLVRLNDKYGREAQGYEKSNQEYPRSKDELFFDNEMIEIRKKLFFEFSGCHLVVEKISDLNQLNNLKSDEVIIFLDGGLLKIVDKVLHFATIPGDVGNGAILSILIENVHSVSADTIILRINK